MSPGAGTRGTCQSLNRYSGQMPVQEQRLWASLLELLPDAGHRALWDLENHQWFLQSWLLPSEQRTPPFLNIQLSMSIFFFFWSHCLSNTTSPKKIKEIHHFRSLNGLFSLLTAPSSLERLFQLWLMHFSFASTFRLLCLWCLTNFPLLFCQGCCFPSCFMPRLDDVSGATVVRFTHLNLFFT